MRYYTKRHKVFGIKYGGNVEIPVLKFLYSRREYDRMYYVKRIANYIHLDSDSVRGALNRLHDRGYVISDRSRQDERYTIWRIRRNADVYREVEKRIGIRRKTVVGNDYNEENSNEDYIDQISDTIRELSPFKNALQSAFPHTAVPLEIGYQMLTNLPTVRDIYNLTTASSSDEFKNALNETVEDATKSTYHYIKDVITQPIRDKIIPNIVETSSRYLEKKGLFKDITESFNLDESYSDDFKDFYKTSLSSCLKEGLKDI